MLKSPKTYGLSGAHSVALIVLGVFFMFAAWGMWSANAPKATSAGDWILIFGFDTFFILIAVLTIGFRTKFTIYPKEKRMTQVMRLFGIEIKSSSWNFSEVSGIDIKSRTAGRSGSRAYVNLLFHAIKAPVSVDSYMMGSQIPTKALSTARELSETIGVPFYTPQD
jgi:hypothetical protein